VIIHAQLTREDQLHRIKTLGLIPSYFSAHTFFWGDWHRQSFGEDRAGFISPVGRSAELGIPFTVHNDAPVVPPDVMRLLWATVNRETRSGFILGPDQRATPMQALHAVTLGAAYQYFEEDRKGSITPGKQADLVILGANPITSDPNSIKDIPVLETFSRGRSIYRADGP
ncbi:MAG: amidohydrolase family protein, partial [Gammaproteobacteria bacterium]|nr:amidohydrolase family protein [Gammaproteobacteria bacterium]